MASYKKFLIQQQTFNGTTYANIGDVVDTYTKFGVVCQEMPFKYLPETKDLPKRDWYDEDGEDVYIPTDGMKFKAYDVEAKFLYVGTESNMASKLKAFKDFICGKKNIVSGVTVSTTHNVMLKIYDEYTRTGRRGVYVQSVSNDLFFFNDVSIDAIAQFKVKFRVTDPVYEVTYSGGALT